MRFLAPVLASLGWVLTAGTALADQPHPWQLGFQEPASPVMQRIDGLHDAVLIIITAITLFVLALLLVVIFRYNERRNPKPSRTSHNTLVEIAWTVVPVVILLGIAIPSFRLLYFADRTAEPEMTIKAIGHQWNWSYEYPDHGNFTFDSEIVPEEELQEGQPRLLETNNRIVVPIGTDIRVLVTSTDVLHSWALPSAGVKIDAEPGRTNETWMHIEREGTYYGQCSELCGVGHGYMPIAVEAVSKERFDQWVGEAQQKFARVDGSAATQLAQQ